MDFYVSWYYGDPLYQLYDDECYLLVSPTSVSSRWSLREFPRMPRRVMIDSGGYRYMIAGGKLPTPHDAFEKQLRILGEAQIPAILCALDYPMAEPSLDPNELDRRITETIANAYEFRLLADQYGSGREIEFMAIIQGYDPASVTYCAHELKAMGFTAYGIGSLAGLRHHDETLSRVKAAISVVGQGVHVFGLSSIRTIRALKQIGVKSIDSSRPVKSAAYNEVLYSHPFRRFGVLVGDQTTGIVPKRRCLSQPLPCTCPVCQRKDTDILRVGDRKPIGLRAVHNYFHMKWAITR